MNGISEGKTAELLSDCYLSSSDVEVFILLLFSIMPAMFGTENMSNSLDEARMPFRMDQRRCCLGHSPTRSQLIGFAAQIQHHGVSPNPTVGTQISISWWQTILAMASCAEDCCLASSLICFSWGKSPCMQKCSGRLGEPRPTWQDISIYWLGWSILHDLRTC